MCRQWLKRHRRKSKAAASILNWGNRGGCEEGDAIWACVPEDGEGMWAGPQKRSPREELQVFLTLIKGLIIFTELMVQPGSEDWNPFSWNIPLYLAGSRRVSSKSLSDWKLLTPGTSRPADSGQWKQLNPHHPSVHESLLQLLEQGQACKLPFMPLAKSECSLIFFPWAKE